MTTLLRTKIFIEDLNCLLEKVDSTTFSNEVYSLRSDLDDLEREINQFENNNQKNSLFSIFQNNQKIDQDTVDYFQKLAKDIEPSIKRLMNDTKSIETERESFRGSLDKLSKKLETFYQLYGFVFTVVDKNERRVAVSSMGDVFSLSSKVEDIQNIYCLGGTGSGKTKLFESLILQDPPHRCQVLSTARPRLS